jgi:hypothetical protein
VDAREPDALSHSTDMTPRKRREWARFFLSARRQGLGGLKLILFSIACASDAGSVVPVLLAARAVWRIAPAQSQGRRVRPSWHLPPTWAPRLLGVLAFVVVAWGLSLGGGQTPRTKGYVDTRKTEVPEWLFVDQGDAGVVARKMPGVKMKGQQGPPCDSTQVLLSEACWDELKKVPPCGEYFEHEGRCYVPVVEKKRPPTSVDP